MALLPDISTEDDYRARFPQNDVWAPAVRAICDRHGLDPSAIQRGTLGSNVVFQCGDVFVKLFPPLWAADFVRERTVLSHVRGLPIPELVAEGDVEEWPYLVVSAVPGTPAGELWPELEPDDRANVVLQLGQLMRRLHEHSIPADLPADWVGFLRERLDRAETHQAVGEPWLTWLRERIAGFAEPNGQRVVLSADITGDHVLLGRVAGRLEITGFIDFGDARVGHPWYEFVAPFAFYTFGRPGLSRLLVESYGLPLTPELADRLTTWCLLHEFGRISDFLESCPVDDGAGFHRALWGALGQS